MKVRISYQHVSGHSQYDREWIGEGENFETAREAAVKEAMREFPFPYLRIPALLGWENRVYQGNNMLVVLYDFWTE